MKSSRVALAHALLLAATLAARASSVIPLSTPEAVRVSDAVLRGTVVALSCFKDDKGLIYTRTALRVDEPLKGKFPPMLLVVHRGGQVDNQDEFCGLSPRFMPGREYLVFVARGEDGTLHCIQGHASAFPLRRASAKSGKFLPQDESLLDEVRQLTQNGQIPGADVTDQAARDSGGAKEALTGMLGGVASRFLQPDRGEPIPYLVDATSLPAGITVTVATNAVQQALNAWAAVTSLKFKFDGFQNFGKGADQITLDDEKLRIQLNDNYNSINAPNVLGIGGRGASSSVLPNTTWNIGGNVAGNEFMKTGRGYVVLEATNSALQSPVTLAEVLCHEIGHALNLAHSSEIVTNDPVLTNAMMYFKAHADGRGATLGAYDPPVIQQVYPSNTVPFGFDRVLDVVTASAAPNVAGINEIRVAGFDLQTTNLTLLTANATTLNGSFAVAGSKLTYTPDGYYSDSERLNPAGSYYWDSVDARISDGTNASPHFSVRVMSLTGDSGSPSDGIPDYWMSHFFGHADPRAGDKSRATDDANGDGLNNLQEYIAGNNPTNSNSAQRISSFTGPTLQFQGKPYELYQLLGSTNLANWTSVPSPFVPTNAPIEILTNLLATNVSVSVSNLPISEPQMFFRVLKVP